MSEVQKTLVEAVLLVVLVIIVFLQSWRAAIVPIIAIPVSLIGTFAVLAGLGYSLNTLSMFGLVLAIGIVVDDAIVVVENVERNLEHGLSPREAAHRSMDEVSTALVAIVLVLCAVFVPVTFLTGITGEFYRQFAVTISAATIISLILSLTLSPAVAALLLKPKSDHRAETGVMGIASPRRRSLQRALRGAERMVWPLHPARRQCAEEGADRLCRSRRGDRFPVLGDPGRLHSGAGPGLCAGRGPASARKLDRAHRRGAEEGRRPAAQGSGHRGRGDVRRLRRRLGDAGVQRRRRLCHLQAVRGARRYRPDRAQHRK